MNHVKKAAEILGKSLLAILLAVAFLVGVMVVVGIVSAIIGLSTGRSVQFGMSALGGIGQYLQPVCFMTAAFAMYAWFERKRGWPLGWKQPRSIRSFSEGMLWGIVLMTAAFALIGLFGGYRITGTGLHAGNFWQWANGSLLFVFVAVNEELLTRGYIQGLIRFHYGPVAAVIATSALFASMHLFNDDVMQSPLPLLNLFLAGILLGVGRELSGGLWMPIGLHFTWNLFQGNVFGFAVSGHPVASVIAIEPEGPELWSGGAFGAEGSLAAVIIITAGILLVAARYRYLKPPGRAKDMLHRPGTGNTY